MSHLAWVDMDSGIGQIMAHYVHQDTRRFSSSYIAFANWTFATTELKQRVFVPWR